MAVKTWHEIIMEQKDKHCKVLEHMLSVLAYSFAIDWH